MGSCSVLVCNYVSFVLFRLQLYETGKMILFSSREMSILNRHRYPLIQILVVGQSLQNAYAAHFDGLVIAVFMLEQNSCFY